MQAWRAENATVVDVYSRYSSIWDGVFQKPHSLSCLLRNSEIQFCFSCESKSRDWYSRTECELLREKWKENHLRTKIDFLEEAIERAKHKSLLVDSWSSDYCWHEYSKFYEQQKVTVVNNKVISVSHASRHESGCRSDFLHHGKSAA